MYNAPTVSASLIRTLKSGLPSSRLIVKSIQRSGRVNLELVDGCKRRAHGLSAARFFHSPKIIRKIPSLINEFTLANMLGGIRVNEEISVPSFDGKFVLVV